MAKTAQLKLDDGTTDEPDITYPAKTIAALLMITDRRVRQLAQEGIIPKASRGRYPLTGCVHGYINYLQKLKEDDAERSGEKTRLTRARADTYELELRVRTGELYPREIVDETLFAVASQLTAMLDGSASRIASKLGGGAKLRQQLIDEFHGIRDQFARGLREFSASLRKDGWHRGAAARSKSRRVGKKKPRPAKRRS